MSFRFEKLEVWQDARIFASLIYKTTSAFPKNEIFGLTDQLRRASVSVALNIAEGSDRKSDKEFRKFLRTSITSIARKCFKVYFIEEVVTALYISQDQGYLTKVEFDKIYISSNNLAARINALINSLSSRL